MTNKYNGMCGDAEGNFYVDFNINGKTRELFVKENEIRQLAEKVNNVSDLPVDGCAEIVDDDIRQNADKYIKHWHLA